MNFENIITGLSFIVSIIAIYFATKKQVADVKNSDADTIAKMFANFKEQEGRYKQLKEDFERYKQDMDAQFAAIVSENVKLRAWAKKLARQLEQANIVPIKYDD
jgi:predicted ArsR family transcriptional regulator